MMELFLRDNEESARRGEERRVGVVVFVRGKRSFFAGGSPELAMTYARVAVAPGVLDDPDTRVEFGVAHGTAWACEKVIKHGNQPDG